MAEFNGNTAPLITPYSEGVVEEIEKDLNVWLAMGCLDYHGWVAGMHVVYNMRHACSTEIVLSIHQMQSTAIVVGGKPRVGPLSGLPWECSGVLQQLQDYVGIFSHENRSRLLYEIEQGNHGHFLSGPAKPGEHDACWSEGCDTQMPMYFMYARGRAKEPVSPDLLNEFTRDKTVLDVRYEAV